MDKSKNIFTNQTICTAEYYQALFDDYLKYQRGLSLDYRKRLCKRALLFFYECSGSEIIDIEEDSRLKEKALKKLTPKNIRCERFKANDKIINVLKGI
jgi:hypothetical protein